MDKSPSNFGSLLFSFIESEWNFMQKAFKSHGLSCAAKFFASPADDSYMIYFYEECNTQYCSPLSNLVIPPPTYGFLHLQFIGEDAILSGFLDKQHFSKEMVADILIFIEDALPKARNIYLPYHIDFVSISDCEEYNGEY